MLDNNDEYVLPPAGIVVLKYHYQIQMLMESL